MAAIWYTRSAGGGAEDWEGKASRVPCTHHNVGRPSAGQKLWVCAVSSAVTTRDGDDEDDDATNCEIGL